jgi:two-component system, cell cycle sensor histidine kinase and response regulator CckA
MDTDEAVRRLQSIFYASASGIVVADDDAVYLDANPAACAIYGRSLEEIVGVKIGLVEGSAPISPELWAKMIGETGAEHLATVHRPDGTTAVVRIRSIGEFVTGQHIFSLHDESEVLRAQKQIRLASELVDNLPVGTYIISFSADVQTYISPVAERMLGYPGDAWADPTFIERIVHEDDRPAIVANTARMLSGELDSDEREYRVTTADGRLLWVYGAVDLIRDGNGRPLYMRGYYIDVTERKQLEEQLRQSQRMETVGRLAGGIAHDFNNLLTAIIGYSGLALSRLGGADDALRHDVEQIQRSADRAALLTEQLLAFSRRQVLQPRTLDLNVVIEDIRSLLTRLIGENIEIVTAHHGDELFVRADPGRLEQVLVNLAVNARDSMPAGGRLTIEAAAVDVDADHPITTWGAKAGSYRSIVVRDNGHGMDDETLAHAFEPFFTTKEIGKGTGLGLATVYGIVKQSGGWITLESEVGAGTTVTIYFVPDTEPAQRIEEERPAAVTGSGRILYVEDEEVVRNLVKELLENFGYEVLEAATPSEALQIATDELFDLLLTDVVMPQMNGRQLALRIREKRPDLHVLYMSGYSPETALDGEHLEPTEFFLQKPFDSRVLAATVGDAMQSAARAAGN